MSDENLSKTFTAYLDDAEGISDEGHIFTVIASVLIRHDLSSRIESKLEEIWERYLPGIDRKEFHAKDLEEATLWPFSTMGNGEPLKMQEELIDIIDYSDLPVVAVTIDDKTIQSNPMLGAHLKYLNRKVLATSLSIAVSISSLIDVSRGEQLKLAADEGLIKSKNRRTIEEAIRFLQAFGAKDFSELAKKEGFVPSAAMAKFSVDARMPEVASYRLAGLQLADHVARYVFKYAKNPNQPDPRYLELISNGLTYRSWKENQGTVDLFPGVTVHIRPRKGTSLARTNEAEEKARLEDLKRITSQFKKGLQDKFNMHRECPECKTKLFWGSPTKEIQKAIDNGELLIVASSIKPQNYCPCCGAIVFTLAEYAEELKKIINHNS